MLIYYHIKQQTQVSKVADLIISSIPKPPILTFKDTFPDS